MTDDYKEIVVEEASENGDWEYFREKLLSAESKNKSVCSITRLALGVCLATNPSYRERLARAHATLYMTSTMT